MKLLSICFVSMLFSAAVYAQQSGSCSDTNASMNDKQCAIEQEWRKKITEKSSAQPKWYEGGTLHKKKGIDWRQASEQERLATSANIAVEILEDRVDDVTELKLMANNMSSCLSDASANSEADQWQVARLAAICAIALGWVQ